MKSATADVRGGQRVVEGIVAANGTVQNPGSSDWTVVKTATGGYSLRFSPPFRGVPVVHTTVIGFAVIGVNPTNADSASILSYAPPTGALTDIAFHFRAEGRAL
jgi:hypothetical protein